MQIEWLGSPNFWPGRKGRRPIAIVNHITAGLMPGCLSHMQNATSQASSNYLVTKGGRVIQMVTDESAAWANGMVNRPSWNLYDGTNPNLYTISIEHESKGEELTETQYHATLWLHRQLVEKWEIPVDSDHIIGHYRIDSVDRPNCPGPNFPWDRLFKDLQGGETVVADWKIAVMQEAEGLGLIMEGQHKPEEPADKAFVMAVLLKVYKKIGDTREMESILQKVAGATAKYMVKK